MKILQIVPAFRVAGAETMCENLCISLKNNGQSVIAVSLYSEHTVITNRLEAENIQVVYLGKKPGFDLSIFFKLFHLFHIENPDVVHTHIYASKYALPMATLCGIEKRVHTIHNIAQQEQTKVGKIVNKFMFKHCHVIPVALSQEIQRTVHDVYNVENEKIPVIYNGINLLKCQPKMNYEVIDNFKILHIGRFMDVKNHEMMLKTFLILLKRYPNIQLNFVGEGDLLSEIRNMAIKLGIDKKVIFWGMQPNVYSYLHDADLFILPSKFEGLPMTLIEAMGTGLPIIASAVGGIPDMLKDEESALLIQPNINELVKAVERLYQKKDLRYKLGKAAIKRASDFSADTMAQKYMNLYLKERDR